MGFEIDVDLLLKPSRPFRLTDSTKTLRKGVMSSCLAELLFQAKMKMNLDHQVKVTLVLEEDETEVDNEEFFQTLKDHAVLVVITEPIPSRDAKGNPGNPFLEALLVPSKANIPGNNEKTDYSQNQLPTYEEAQNSISSNFDGTISNKPAPIVEEITLSRSTLIGGIDWACLVDKKTGSKKIFVFYRYSFADSARGKLQNGDQILSIDGHQIRDHSNFDDGYPMDKKMTLEILHDANFRRLKQVNFDLKSHEKHGGKLGMEISCHSEMGSVLITKIDPMGRAKDAGLKVGERVFGINGISLLEVTMTEVIDALRNSKETIKFLVQETKAGRKELAPREPEPCCLLM